MSRNGKLYCQIHRLFYQEKCTFCYPKPSFLSTLVIDQLDKNSRLKKIEACYEKLKQKELEAKKKFIKKLKKEKK